MAPFYFRANPLFEPDSILVTFNSRHAKRIVSSALTPHAFVMGPTIDLITNAETYSAYLLYGEVQTFTQRVTLRFLGLNYRI